MNRMRSLITKQILELKNTVIELKNSIESFNARFNHAEERFSKLRNR